MNWRRDEVDRPLHNSMKNIHETCVRCGRQDDRFINCAAGANTGGFIKVADAMLDHGLG